MDELNAMRDRAIDSRTMMAITNEEIEHLILNNICQPGMQFLYES